VSVPKVVGDFLTPLLSTRYEVLVLIEQVLHTEIGLGNEPCSETLKLGWCFVDHDVNGGRTAWETQRPPGALDALGTFRGEQAGFG